MTNIPRSYHHQDYVVVLPAYQPSTELITLAHSLYKSGYTLVVVDDGSGPEASGIFEAIAPFSHLLCHDENRGKGAALKTAFRFITDELPDARIIVTMDADGQRRFLQQQQTSG